MSDRMDGLRADARANRDRILEVARGLLATDPDVSINAVGKAAGVGQGTLYRHFPSREALIVGVYRKELDAIVALAPALLRAHAPLEAFQTWCGRLAEFGRMKHGVAGVLRAAISDRDVRETYWPMVDAVRQMLDACVASSDINPDADAEDVLTLLSVLWQVSPEAPGEGRTARLTALIFRGLGADVDKIQIEGHGPRGRST